MPIEKLQKIYLIENCRDESYELIFHQCARFQTSFILKIIINLFIPAVNAN